MKIWVWVRHEGTRGIKSERLGSLTSLQQGGTSRSTLRRSFAAVAYAMAIVLASSNLLTPLYATYQRIFHFSPLMLTLIFATYAIFLVPSLVVFGQLSDRVGRRRVIAAGLVGGAVSLALFASAHSTLWLFAARAVQGTDRLVLHIPFRCEVTQPRGDPLGTAPTGAEKSDNGSAGHAVQ